MDDMNDEVPDTDIDDNVDDGPNGPDMTRSTELPGQPSSGQL